MILEPQCELVRCRRLGFQMIKPPPYYLMSGMRAGMPFDSLALNTTRSFSGVMIDRQSPSRVPQRSQPTKIGLHCEDLMEAFRDDNEFKSI